MKKSKSKVVMPTMKMLLGAFFSAVTCGCSDDGKLNKEDICMYCDGCGKGLTLRDKCFTISDFFRCSRNTYCVDCGDVYDQALRQYELWCKVNYGGRVIKNGIARKIEPYDWYLNYKDEWVSNSGVEKAEALLNERAALVKIILHDAWSTESEAKLKVTRKAIREMCNQNIGFCPIPFELNTLVLLDGDKILREGACYVSTNCDIALTFVYDYESPESGVREWRFHMANVKKEELGGVVDDHEVEVARLPLDFTEKLETQEGCVRLPPGWYSVSQDLDRDSGKLVFAGRTRLWYLGNSCSLTIQDVEDIWTGRKVFRNKVLVDVGSEKVDYEASRVK